jgi:repressor LexA
MLFKISKPQQEVYEFIRAFMKIHGFPPTYDEMEEALKKSRTTINGHVKRLRAKGLLSIKADAARGIRLIDRSAKAVDRL